MGIAWEIPFPPYFISPPTTNFIYIFFPFPGDIDDPNNDVQCCMTKFN